MTESLTFLDFFSGIGGFRKGFELCGMKCKGHCEINKFADRSYRCEFNVTEDEWYEKDITKIKPEELPRTNLWSAGFPCQDISCSGRQRGLAGERSSLFFEIVRLLKGTSAEDRPEWLVLENVKNLLYVNKGWDFETVLRSLAEVGYNIEYGLLNSKLHGVPQNRERVYIVAYRHFRAQCGRKIFPVEGCDGKALVQLLGGRQGKRVYDIQGISSTLTAHGGGFAGKTGLYFIDMCQGNPVVTENARCITARYNSGISRRSCCNSGVLVRDCESCDKIMLVKNNINSGFTAARCGDSVDLSFPNSQTKHTRVMKNCSHTLTTSCRTGVAMARCGRIRRLTPRESWRLQGFTDDMFDKAAAVNSDSQLYAQAGNSVTIPVVYSVGKRIMEIQTEIDKEKDDHEKQKYTNTAMAEQKGGRQA